ncbi:MAG: MarR family transcriptional regulator [Burkholderiaceae bacterium]
MQINPSEVVATTSRLAEPAEHDDLLNYRLKVLLSIAGAPAIRLCEGGFGITRQEWRVLAALVESGAMSPSRLAERVQLERAVVSRRVTALVDKRLVERTRSSTDARRAEVRANMSGQRLYSELFPRLAAINRRLMAGLDPAEALALERALDKLTTRARQIQREGDGVEARADRRHGGSRRHLPPGSVCGA